MSMICGQCGKELAGEGMAFCPYCGAKLQREEQGPRDEATEGWIRKARSVTSYPERKKILQKALAECPGNRDLLWEMLFIGEEGPKKGFVIDYSIIKSWILEIYRKPKDLPEAKREQMRAGLFDDPALRECLSLFENPEEKQRAYLLRLCRDYIDIFLEGDSQVMGKFLGFSLERNKEKKLAEPVAGMIRRMREDEKLLPDQREQLANAMYQAYVSRSAGNAEYLRNNI